MSRPRSVEAEFRAAFERLKKDKPNTVAKGTVVSISNVAKEAGKNPGSLRCERYPELCVEIRAYAEINYATTNDAKTNASKKRKTRESDARRIKRLMLENEKLTNIVVSLMDQNEQMEHEIAILRAAKLVDLNVKKRTRL
jgi:hypothetical protein